MGGTGEYEEGGEDRERFSGESPGGRGDSNGVKGDLEEGGEDLGGEPEGGEGGREAEVGGVAGGVARRFIKSSALEV